jgi:hypothetical protein
MAGQLASPLVSPEEKEKRALEAAALRVNTFLTHRQRSNFDAIAGQATDPSGARRKGTGKQCGSVGRRNAAHDAGDYVQGRATYPEGYPQSLQQSPFLELEIRLYNRAPYLPQI